MSATPRVVLLMVPYAGYDRGLLDGIARYAQLHGPWVFFLSGEHPQLSLPASEWLSGKYSTLQYVSRNLAHSPLPDLRRWGATGVIGRLQTASTYRRIRAAQLPLVAVDVWTDNVRLDQAHPESEIRADSVQAGRLAAEHFLERGFRRFGFCGYRGRPWSFERQQGFTERLQEAGFDCNIYEPRQWLRAPAWDREQSMVLRWLKSLPRPVAVMACNDIRGRQVLETCLLAGLRVPDEVAVVGADDDSLFCSLSNPPLSSVAFNLEKAGYRGAELLDGMMNGHSVPPANITVECLWVVPRRSTDAVALEDRHVVSALRFIRDNAKYPISVADVVTQAGVSRRALEIRFQRTLGRSIRGEIQRVRLEKTQRLLVETNLPAERVAELAGFSSLSYLSNIFRREMGMTLRQYGRRMRLPS